MIAQTSLSALRLREGSLFFVVCVRFLFPWRVCTRSFSPRCCSCVPSHEAADDIWTALQAALVFQWWLEKEAHQVEVRRQRAPTPKRDSTCDANEPHVQELVRNLWNILETFCMRALDASSVLVGGPVSKARRVGAVTLHFNLYCADATHQQHHQSAK